jgi:hypothetical protein
MEKKEIYGKERNNVLVLFSFFSRKYSMGDPHCKLFIKHKELRQLYRRRNKKGGMPEVGSRAKLEQLYKKGRRVLNRSESMGL